MAKPSWILGASDLQKKRVQTIPLDLFIFFERILNKIIYLLRQKSEFRYTTPNSSLSALTGHIYFHAFILYLAPEQGRQPIGDKILMSIERPCHFAHLLACNFQ